MSADVTPLPLSAHQRVLLARRFPGLWVEALSKGLFRFHLRDSFVNVRLAPYAGWVVSHAYLSGTMVNPAPEDEIWVMRTMLIDWIAGAISER